MSSSVQETERKRKYSKNFLDVLQALKPTDTIYANLGGQNAIASASFNLNFTFKIISNDFFSSFFFFFSCFEGD